LKYLFGPEGTYIDVIRGRKRK